MNDANEEIRSSARWPGDLTRRTFARGAVGLGAVGLAGASPALPDPDKPDKGWRIGCYTRPWGKHEYRVALDAIAEAGFKHVGLMAAKAETRLVISVETTPDEARLVGDECRSRGLSIPSVWGGAIPIQNGLEAGIAGLTKLIDNCAAAGAEDLMMGGVGAKATHDDYYYKAIAECCDYAAEKRVALSLKPHGGTNATGAQCRDLVTAIGHKNFRIWYDPGNIFFYSDGKRDPATEAGEVDGLVVGMSVKDYRHPKQVALTPGDGQVDFPAVMARLAKGGFTSGPLVIECLADGDLPALAKEAKRARRFVEELVA